MNEKESRRSRFLREKKSAALILGATFLSALAAVAVALLLVDIARKKEQAQNPFFRVVALNDDSEDPAQWGKNFPQQYDGYRRTVEMHRTRYGGSEAMPRLPTAADPRRVVAFSRLDADPRLKKLWAGYPFAVDFRARRGHAYMLDDQTYTERQRVVKQPGTCLHCHASVYTAYKRLGQGDLERGFEVINRLPYFEARRLVTHPLACIDCHDPATMQLRITRPAFMEGIRQFKAGQGTKNYDVNRDASRQEMRSYVCGQCHVEYYFAGPEKRLTYPWAKGLEGDRILAYYDRIQFKDWQHGESGAPVLKAQHPEFEMWNQGIHAANQVACADCHMPYQRVGAQKISDHQVQSPLLNINRACQTCHRAGEKELLARAEQIQKKTIEMRDLALDALLQLIEQIKAQSAVASPAALEQARQAQRRAQFLLDFVEAENSSGFHAPQEAARLLTHALDETRRGQQFLFTAPKGVVKKRAKT